MESQYKPGIVFKFRHQSSRNDQPRSQIHMDFILSPSLPHAARPYQPG
jgi:hypothetical protein